MDTHRVPSSCRSADFTGCNLAIWNDGRTSSGCQNDIQDSPERQMQVSCMAKSATFVVLLCCRVFAPPTRQSGTK